MNSPTPALAALLALFVQLSPADDTIKPVQSDTIKPFQAETIKPANAQSLKPMQGETVRPVQSGSIAPDKATPVKPRKTNPTNSTQNAIERPSNPDAGIALFQADQTKRLNPAGIDPAPVPAPLDKKLVGTWQLSVPGVAYQTEKDTAQYTERKLNVGAGSAFGVLTINEKGEYRWTRHGRTNRGNLQQVVPRNYADPKQTYWRIQDETETFYLAAERPDEITLYSPGSNLFAAGGKRLKTGRR